MKFKLLPQPKDRVRMNQPQVSGLQPRKAWKEAYALKIIHRPLLHQRADGRIIPQREVRPQQAAEEDHITDFPALFSITCTFAPTVSCSSL